MGRVKVNLTLDADVVETARSLGLNMSRLAEAAIIEAGRYAAFPGLTPFVERNGTVWIVRVQELAAIPGAEPGNQIGSRADQRDALARAFDIPVDGV